MGTFFGAGSPEPGVRALAIRTGKFKTTDVFVEARFGKDKHYVHLRGAKNLPDTLNDADTVSVHSGMCLFSEGALRFWDENGDNPSLLRHLAEGPTSRLTRITTDDQLSLYEHTSLAHLPRAIADVATALPADLPLTVVIDIPRVQYYGYLLDAFRRGLATGELALEWFDLVDARHTRISRLFHDRVQAQLATACGDRSTTVVCPAPGLDLLAEPIRESVSKGVPPRHEDLVDLLAGSGDPVWDLLLRLESPTTSTELNDASYTVEILRSVAIHQDDGKNLAITVDSYEEFPRREHAQRVMDEVGPPGQLPVLGIYAAERLLNVDSQGQPTTPYLLDPGRYVADESGSTVDLFDLIDHLYA
ncbi:hypothetical protein [Saccharothrix deserti]|uniref:hypothetical protein n=1 Tax=Saccharothrix deserti TaxID=2593674 RepID=UPI00131D700C|nr:hypothetical protein [Saccharothrix deserti]